MLGLRASAKRLREHLNVDRRIREETGLGVSETAAVIAHAIYRREQAGSTTTLRQVHHLADVKQPEALRIVRDLETRGLAIVEDDIHDALESTISLSVPMRARLAEILREDIG